MNHPGSRHIRAGDVTPSRSGVWGSPALRTWPDLTTARMPMSKTAAIQLRVLAEVHLGC